MDVANSNVVSKAGSYFAQDANAAIYEASSKVLNYDLVDRDDPKGKMKKCLMGHAEAGINQNDNSTASMNVLDGSYIPMEGWAEGFLKPQPNTYSGAVFDTVIYHIVFEQTGALVAESFYAEPDRLVVKYQGGGDYSYHSYNVPEPATLALFCLGGLLIRKRRAR